MVAPQRVRAAFFRKLKPAEESHRVHFDKSQPFAARIAISLGF
jgi:hypothetical protein